MKKKKSGFTLIELLAVIAILGILATIATTSAIGVSLKLKQKMYCEKLDFIENAAKQYGSDMLDSLNTTGITLSLGELVNRGKLKADQNVAGSYIIDPRDNSSMDHITVRIYLKNKRAYAHVNVDRTICER